MSPGSFGSRMTEGGRLLHEGPPARMTAAAIAESRADAVPLLYGFALEAGQIRPTPTSSEPFPTTDPGQQQIMLLKEGIDWAAVTRVGEGYIDAQCDRFITALDQLERSKRGTLANLNAMQSATVGIMGLAVAAQQAIGIVGIAFGLVASLIDNSTSVVLYQLPASSIRTIVTAQRDVLRLGENVPNGVMSQVGNQGLASARLAEYIQYCVPVTIEANVGKVLNNTRGDDKGNIITGPTSAAVTSALAPVISGIPPGTVVNQVTPEKSKPGGIVDRPVRERMKLLFGVIRGLSDPQTLKSLADVLKLDTTEADPPSRNQNKIIAKVNNFVISGEANSASQRMDEISKQLRPILKQDF